MAEKIFASAGTLEQAIRESEEFHRLKQLYEEVFSDEETRNLFTNFRDMQLRLQEKQMKMEPISEEEVKEAQETVSLIQANEKIVQLMQAEQEMSVVIMEINKIVMKPLEELYSDKI